jgi:hypothetical protein
LVIAIILFRVLKILEGKELAALLSLGSLSECAPTLAGNNPTQNNSALGRNANPSVD